MHFHLRRQLFSIVFVCLTIISGVTLAQEGLDWEGTLPLTPDVRYGVLENGLTYYIQHHEQPAERVEMQLVLRVGALQETEAQLGLAHFLEHMMFNGTENFPENELIDFFELNGMQFGPDINAFTSYEITTYLLSVNSADPELYATAYQVLLDWATRATLDPVEVEKEVGVIIEEWRVRQQNASGRINEQAMPIIFGEDSRYVTRDIIGGDMSIVESAPVEELRNFYETWYRPELMALIIVGDIDVDDAEARIRETFGPLTNAPGAPLPERYALEAHAETRIGILTDPEFPATAIQVFRKVPGGELVTLGDYRDFLRDQLFYAMLGERLEERQRQADAPYLYASAFGGITLAHQVEYHGFAAGTSEEDLRQGLAAVLDEIERVRRDGFSEGELTDAKANLQQNYDDAYEEREFRTNESIANEYRRHFSENEISPGIEAELELLATILPTLTLETMNELAGLILEEADRVVLVIAPERALDVLPSEEELRAELSARRDVAAYQEVELVDALLTDLPEAAAIVSEREIEGAEWPLTEWVFANGVRLLLMPTDLAEREVLLSGISPGGSSLLSDEEYLAGTFVNEVVNQSGVGDLSQDELERYLSGRQVGVSLSLGSEFENIRGFANNDELETLFQLIYLYSSQPRLDEGAFEAARERQIVALETRDLDPIIALIDAIDELLGDQDSPRYRPATIAEMEALVAAEAFAIWRSRWQEMGDFSFALVGSFEPAAVRELAQRYLGNLPSLGGSESWIDRDPPYPDALREKTVYAGLEEQTIFLLAYLGAFAGDEQDAAALEGLGDIIRVRANETLREELSGTYSPFATASVSRIPKSSFILQTYFFSNPEKYEDLRAATFAILNDLRENGPTAAEVEGFQTRQRNNLEERREENGYWLSALRQVMQGIESDYGHTRHEAALWEGVTAAAIQAQAEFVLNREGYLSVSLFPAAYAPAEEE
ncbi:MAG: insulinase family protein [Anaerolineaceae bacterium]|nr:insulinase family protein [Anaerolineaceae bacterium]